MQFEKIQNNGPKVPELVMDSLLKAMEAGTIRVGEELPPERDLAEALGISRNSLRECLAILSFMGIVENRGNRKILVKYADRILFPYEPSVVVFQTGSNDYVCMPGTDDEKVSACMAFKRQMFADFHARLPEARFVVMSGLLLPGRARYTGLTQEVNRQLEQLCEERADYMTFVNAETMTFDGTTYAENLFIRDGIHLNHEGQLCWRDGYILPALKKLTGEGDVR